MYPKFLCFIVCIVFFIGTADAQMADCSPCDVLALKASDIRENTSEELELLRNEIFARNQYRFKNKALTNHFMQYDWYQPEFDLDSEVNLNPVERDNVKLFLSLEDEINKEKEIVTDELIAFKKALNRNDVESVLPRLNDKIAINKLQLELENLKNLINEFDLSNLIWIDDHLKQRITVDDGRMMQVYELASNREEIWISHVVKNETKLNPQLELKDDLILLGKSTWHFTVGRSKISLKEHVK